MDAEQVALSTTTEPEELAEFAPDEGEGGVLSVLAAREGERWVVVGGSLLTVPEEAMTRGWGEWADYQPPTRGPSRLPPVPRLPHDYLVYPFGMLMARRTVLPHEYADRLQGLANGELDIGEKVVVNLGPWGARRLLAAEGEGDDHAVVGHVQRPVLGVAADTEAPAVPKNDVLWTRQIENKREHYASWGKEAGFSWPGDLPPPHAFVVGRLEDSAWIADLYPQWNDGQIEVSIGWRSECIDPFSCSILLRQEDADAPILTRLCRVSDLPGELVTDEKGREPRDLPWQARTLRVRLTFGPRRTAMGVVLFDPAGHLLDERPVGRRAEKVSISFGIQGEEPSSARTVGDSEADPSAHERTREAEDARRIDQEAREAAAYRRVATLDEMENYLRWRLSGRAGELLILDRYLIDLDAATEKATKVADFLKSFRRPIRALISKDPDAAADFLTGEDWIEIRLLPQGQKDLHDRLWLVEDVGLLVGGSLNTFAGREEPDAATTVADLPHADSLLWRAKFEEWWPKARPRHS